MNLPRSTYYYQSKSKAVNDAELIALIEAIIEEFPGYGYRRVTRELHRQDMPVNHRKILRIMRQRGLTRKTKTPLDQNDGQPSFSSDLSQFDQKSRCDSPESGLDGGYHLHRHQKRFRLSGRHSGFVCQKSHRLRYFTQHRYRPDDGYPSSETDQGNYSSLGSRRPVCRPGVCKSSLATQLFDQYVP